LNAFLDLAGGFFQYLKDCLCDHFLVNCPTCDPADKLYLAVVSIKNRQVNKVCNFSLRKYVKSFPTVEYWLSLVPIIPLFKQAVERFCCAVLPGFFSKQTAPHPVVTEGQILLADNRVTSSNIRKGVEFVKTVDVIKATSEAVTKVKTSPKIVMDALRQETRQQPAPPQSIQNSDIAGQSVGEAQIRLAAANIKVVAVEPYNPDGGMSNLVAFTRAPLRLEPGAQVKLITKDDKVLYYTSVEETKGVVEAAQLRSELDALKEQMQARDKEIADLKLHVNTINQLKEQFATLSKSSKAQRRRKGEREPKE
jgi:hypothetical protein